ncbi:hypothetical protein ARZXY2_525 [Arthrobacter sp. ZXY-2]|nr:hypothetical protein ARZXY2_525 [Arthrobacter sp. ZXY-2]
MRIDDRTGASLLAALQKVLPYSIEDCVRSVASRSAEPSVVKLLMSRREMPYADV